MSYKDYKKARQEVEAHEKTWKGTNFDDLPEDVRQSFMEASEIMDANDTAENSQRFEEEEYDYSQHMRDLYDN